MDINSIISIVLGIISFIAIVGNVKFRKAIKESKEAWDEGEKALKDGRLTKKEIQLVVKEFRDALIAINSLWQVIKTWDWKQVDKVKTVKKKLKSKNE
jgi:hypothetical protein